LVPETNDRERNRMDERRGYLTGLKCRECGREYPSGAVYACDYCFGPLEAMYDYEAIREVMSPSAVAAGPQNLWRYRPLLPLDGEPTDGHNSGFTPLVRADNLARELGARELYLKDDSVNRPTLSYKDRVVPVALSRAKELGFRTVGCASTGNLANSVAAHAAVAGLKAVIFIPTGLELGKVLGTLVYGPTLVEVKGTYDEVNRLCTEVATKHEWAFVNVNLRPYYTEGAKTCAFEIAEQLGWRAPDHVVLPVAGGTLLPKVWKGFQELHKIGLIPELPTRVHAAQPDGCAPVVTALKEGSAESGGHGDVATDEEIVEAIKLLARTEGIFTETAGGVTIAVLRKLISSGRIPADESVVACVTGNGLKTTEPLSGRLGSAITVEPRTTRSDRRPGRHRLASQSLPEPGRQLSFRPSRRRSFGRTPDMRTLRSAVALFWVGPEHATWCALSIRSRTRTRRGGAIATNWTPGRC
jgi:threonine synthase